MEKIEILYDTYPDFCVGNWTVRLRKDAFIINNNGMKFVFKFEENPEKILFDTDKKTISVIVKNPTLPENAPRVINLSDSVCLFNELRNRIDSILMCDCFGEPSFKNVVPNDDRTIFEIS